MNDDDPIETNGKKYPRSNKEYFESLHSKFKRGDKSMLLYIAYCYEDGVGVKKSLPWAKFFFQQACYSKVTEARKELDLFLEKYPDVTTGIPYVK